MKGVKNNKFKASFKCATRGLQYVIRNERNFRIELVVAIFIVFLSIIFGIKIWEFIIVVFLITGVLVTELMNPFARLIKDITAGVVLISALVSFLVGLLIFLPYIFNLLNFYF
ncbi:MAG: Prokaryotic diacylglycerol kinase [Candidatus Moranbacteria bacterium GW2011_GWF1_35_5]|nr:MAG: Prokaryotic diacylglycerol kinase [Candidatus Moranbacteria bacterium GW2011_GWF1_35_5]